MGHQSLNASGSKVAVVHDYLNQFGGAERVALELVRAWPGSPLYTSIYRPSSTFPEFRSVDVRTGPLQRLPVDRAFRALAPLYPLAFRALGTLSEDVVVSSSSGWAHGVRTRPESLHVVYCHNPARWLYQSGEHLGRSPASIALAPLRPALRRWDRGAARRADLYVANSELVRERIRRVYGLEATVIPPPVDVERFTPTDRGERLLVISRLLPYKRVDLIVRAAARAGLGLDVVGDGPALEELRGLAGPGAVFHGRVDDATLKSLLESCRALCMAAAEDFGIAPLEANAAGKPVIAYGAGGVLETMKEGVTAVFFRELTEDAVVDAISRAEALTTSPTELAAHARRFSAEAFRTRMRRLVDERLGGGRAAG